MQGGDYTLDPQLTAYVAGVGQNLAAVSDRALPYEFVVLEQLRAQRVGAAGRQDRGEPRLARRAAIGGRARRRARPRDRARGRTARRARDAARDAAARRAACDRRAARRLRGPRRGRRERRRAADRRNATVAARSWNRTYTGCATCRPPATIRRLPSHCRKHSCVCPKDAERGRLAALFASHPPSAERVEKNRQTAATLPAGGDLGRERYQAVTARLRQRQPAYEAYDLGQAALAEDRLDEAERQRRKAALCRAKRKFHALLGDIDLRARV